MENNEIDFKKALDSVISSGIKDYGSMCGALRRKLEQLGRIEGHTIEGVREIVDKVIRDDREKNPHKNPKRRNTLRLLENIN